MHELTLPKIGQVLQKSCNCLVKTLYARRWRAKLGWFEMVLSTLSASSLALAAQALQPWLLLASASAHKKACIEVHDEVDSTNDELMRRARNQQFTPSLCIAITQNRGKGQKNRQWISQAEQGLWCSIGLPMPKNLPQGLSLAVGLGVVQGLVHLTTPNAAGFGDRGWQIKWPNDIWWQQRKLGGILIETTPIPHTPAAMQYVVIGMGLNLHAPNTHNLHLSPSGMPHQAATGLHAINPHLSLADVLHAVIPAVIQQVQLFVQHGLTPHLPLFAQCDALLSQALQLSDGTQGIGAGITPQGALLLQTPQGMRTFYSGDVSVRLCAQQSSTQSPSC
jgi:BirA family transcriptional regulator, biotin operon repressor / biotin---[acetyl-CoA-carboxylase] ligase